MRTEELKNENLELGIKLEQERLARLEIQRRLADRFVSSKEEKRIGDAIRPYPGHAISILKVETEGEASKYADQLIKIFGNSKWQVRTGHEAVFSPPPHGLIIRISKNPDAAVKAVIASFEKLGIKRTLVPYENRPSEFIEVVVGVKPPA